MVFITFCRHGQSICNALSEKYDLTNDEELIAYKMCSTPTGGDPPLTNLGINQAKQLGNYLKAWDNPCRKKVAFSSDLVRASETMNLAMEIMDKDAEKITTSDLEENIKYENYNKPSIPLHEFANRLVQIVKSNQYGHIIIFSHHGTTKELVPLFIKKLYKNSNMISPELLNAGAIMLLCLADAYYIQDRYKVYNVHTLYPPDKCIIS